MKKLTSLGGRRDTSLRAFSMSILDCDVGNPRRESTWSLEISSRSKLEPSKNLRKFEGGFLPQFVQG